jgi:integrase
VVGRCEPLIAVLATTGCRIAEPLDLRWSDVGQEQRRPVPRVRKSKTAAGIRTIPLTREMARLLTQRRALAVYTADGDPIFPSAVGTPLTQGNWRKRVFRQARTVAGLPTATPHQLRPGLASLMAEQG